MTVTKKDIEHIAALARIGLSENEIEKYQKELASILEYFKKLEKLDTDKTEPIGHITGMDNVFKSDDVLPSDKEKLQKIFANVPQMKNNQVKVKSVL